MKYSLNSLKKDRLKKELVTLASAAAVAFCALCGGYMNQYAAAQQERIKNVSERQLIVFNHTFSENYLTGENAGIDPEEAERFKGIEGVETVSPVLFFVSDWHITAGVSKYNLTELFSEEELEKGSSLYFGFYNRNGLSRTADEISYLDADGNQSSLYTVQSYAIENYYDPRCDVLDLSVKDGAYITRQFADAIGLTGDMLNGLTLEFDIWVPIAEIGAPVYIQDTSYVNGKEVTEEYWSRFHSKYYEKARISVPVRGIFDAGTLSSSYAKSEIYMPASVMMKTVYQHIDVSGEEASYYIKELEKKNDYANYPVPPTVDTEFSVQSWRPAAYEVIVENLIQVPSAKEAIAAVSPNFDVIQEYQNITAGLQYVSNTRNVMVYISLAVLAVVFLLTALVYVSLIDKRKYEFAVLRANGLTKREVRRVVYAEMALQFALIFVAGLLFAGLIFFIGGKWLGYPFQFDWMTVLWLLLISLGAVVLPTVISLLFVNKFEPDQVMRN